MLKNLSDSISKNLDHFKMMSAEEILNMWSSDDCKGLYDMLTGGGATFRFGAQDTVYEVYSVEFTTGRTTNYSTGFTGNLRATVDFGGSIGEQEFDAPDLLLEQCKPCDEGYYTGVNTTDYADVRTRDEPAWFSH